jgi:hypothetical protein
MFSSLLSNIAWNYIFFERLFKVYLVFVTCWLRCYLFVYFFSDFSIRYVRHGCGACFIFWGWLSFPLRNRRGNRVVEITNTTSLWAWDDLIYRRKLDYFVRENVQLHIFPQIHSRRFSQNCKLSKQWIHFTFIKCCHRYHWTFSHNSNRETTFFN